MDKKNLKELLKELFKEGDIEVTIEKDYASERLTVSVYIDFELVCRNETY